MNYTRDIDLTTMAESKGYVSCNDGGTCAQNILVYPEMINFINITSWSF